MKIQIDTDKEVLRLESDVNLGEFMTKIKTLLPNWKNYKLETNVEVVWSNPIYVERYNWPIYPYPWLVSGDTASGVWCGDGAMAGVSCSGQEGVYCI